ncbi:MAG: hypothetical protein FJ288_12370 [Planctomycetes bacterium]|nr:hypothetical protein [Planctomycetota bacterium]
MLDAPFSPASKMELSREEIYREWLGLKCASPSYYGLLGLPELETDSQVILHAGRRVKRKLRAYQIGPYRKQALDLLAEVGQAVAVLTSPEKKPAYDRELMGRWQAAVTELHHAHCDGAPRQPAVLETWLGACVSRGVPVTRVLPAIVRRLRAQLQDWPPEGGHKVGLPVGLWIYRDAVILGQCLHIGTLDRRVEAVKHVQKTMGVTEGLARVVAEEVSRSLHLFAHARFVGQAKRDPEGYLVRLGRRIRRYGGHLGRRAEVLTTVAALLGLHRKVLERVFERLAEPAPGMSAGRKAAREARLAVRWFQFRPQVVVIGLAVVVGMAALVAAVLVAGGVWDPWPADASRPMPTEPPVGPPAAAADVRPTAEPHVRPPLGPATEADLEALRQFIEKYPSGKPPPATEPEPATPVRPPAKPPKERPPGVKPPTTFFSVPALPGKRNPPKDPSEEEDKEKDKASTPKHPAAPAPGPPQD